MRFTNEPFTDFTDPARQASMRAALAQARTQLGASYALIIDGKTVRGGKMIRSINPSHPREIVGLVPSASREMAERALEAATRAFVTWSRVPVEARAALLQRIADRLRARKAEFTAWLILEVGKNWSEADADVAEAIDFLEYYADQSLEQPPRLTPVSGERNELVYLPLGPVLVIPPWNFPLAILVGMTMAAIVAGNTVIVKPSSQSPVIAALFVQLVQDAGIPHGVLNFLTGAGSTIGDLLVGDRRTRMIAFTGSKAVGIHLNALAARHQKGQRWIKRVIAEMGGKNAIVIDESADLESAVQGVFASAFGYQGQKCSACSRVYVHEKRYADFIDGLVAKAKEIRIGPAEELENFMGPVISGGAQKNILRWASLAKREGKVLAGGGPIERLEGYFVAPTVVERLPPASALWTEEIFGPLIAVAKIKTFNQGLREANQTDYGLTGAVYSADPEHLAQAKCEWSCGNLYLNRKCTGALVGAHPFGGFNLSGTDSKAGGPDYLKLFQQPKTIAERL